MITRRSSAAIIAAFSWPVFFLLRTNVLNQDGNVLTPKLAAAILALAGSLNTYTWIIANHAAVR